jgi:hypothetical protein
MHLLSSPAGESAKHVFALETRAIFWMDGRVKPAMTMMG